MIKLITQFDNEKSKLSLATPTCGGCCCCCCCCIVSTIASASVSARNFGKFVAEQTNDTKKIKTACKYGFWLPIGLIISLIISLIVGVVLSNLTGMYFMTIIVLVGGGFLYLMNMSSSLQKKLNLSDVSSKVIGQSVKSIILQIIGFAIGWLVMTTFITNPYLKSLPLLVTYLIVSIIISTSLIRDAFQKKDNNLGTKNSKVVTNDIDNIQEQEEQKSDIKVDDNNLINEVEQEIIEEKVEVPKKKCSKCGMENAINNKRCIFCSEFFEKSDEK